MVVVVFNSSHIVFILLILILQSMGQSLTFEQSVMEAIDLHKHHKCKDPLCETQLWKVKHELDIALLRINHLKRQIE
jgi:ionotropic glutamate receptor NMDA 2B